MTQLPRLAIFCLALVLPVQAGAPQAGLAPQIQWVDVTVPDGFHVDLATGEVSSRSPGPDSRTLVWSGGRLEARPTLLELDSSDPYSLEGQSPYEGGEPRIGDAFGFTLEQQRWGMLRVLEVREDALVFELSHAPDGADELRREPTSVRVVQSSGQLEVVWPGEPEEEYTLTRRVVGSDRLETHEVQGGVWVDSHSSGTALVEYRVRRRGSSLGSRVRGHRIVTEMDGEVEIARGSSVDLLAGELGGERVDFQVVYLTPPSIALRPGSGVTYEPISKGAWVLPDEAPGRYLPDRVRTTDLSVDLSMRLPEGVFARVSFRVDEDGTIYMSRSIDLKGDRVLPLPPSEPSVTWSGQELIAQFSDRDAGDDELGRARVLAEQEVSPGDWREVARTEPGQRTLALKADTGEQSPQPLVNYRFSHGLPGGLSSAPGRPITFLLGDRTDPEQVKAWLDGAFERLAAEDFERRMEARRLIEALSEEALPRLEGLLLDGDPERSAAARELIAGLEIDSSERARLLLRTEARRMGLEEAPHPGFDDPVPGRRIWSLLVHDRLRAAEAREAWRRVVAQADPDPTVVLFADLMERLPVAVSTTGPPACLVPPEERLQPADLDHELMEELSGGAMAIHLQRAIDIHRPEEAWILLALADRLERAPQDTRIHEDARLSVRLLARWRTDPDPSLLEAARSLAADTTAEYSAWSALVARRFAAEVDEADSREVIRLETPDVDELTAVIDSLAGEVDGYLDVILPAGEYDFTSTGGTLSLRTRGIRLLGEGEVLIRGSVQVRDAVDVVLEGISIENLRGTPLYCWGSEVHLRDVYLTANQSALQATGGKIEMQGVEVDIPAVKGRPRWGVRLTEGADLLARDCYLAAGTLAMASGTRMYLDSCVLEAGEQTGIQGQSGGEVVVRDSLLSGAGMGVLGADEVLLAGVLLDFIRDPLTRGDSGIGLSPDLVWFTPRTPAVDPEYYLPTCPLAPMGR